jgi:hypothetical protein
MFVVIPFSCVSTKLQLPRLISSKVAAFWVGPGQAGYSQSSCFVEVAIRVVIRGFQI